MVDFYGMAHHNLEEARRLYAQPEHLNSLRARGITDPQVPFTFTSTVLAVTQRLLDHGLDSHTHEACASCIFTRYVSMMDALLIMLLQCVRIYTVSLVSSG